MAPTTAAKATTKHPKRSITKSTNKAKNDTKTDKAAEASSVVEDVVASSADYGNEEEYLKIVSTPPTNNADNIRVAVRIRPPNKREQSDSDCRVCVSVPTDRKGVVLVETTPFTYDLAFPMDYTQLQVFEAIGVDIVRCAFNGFNASLFAYGQTSSGKSHSMMGVPGTSLVGLIPRIARLLFAASTNDSTKEVLVETSYMEIYNEKLRDLLGDAKKKTTELKVRENKQLGVHVVGLSKEVVTSESETLAVIDHGTKHRTTAATLYNSESSRSHAVFEITVQSKYQVAGTEMRSRSRVALIDLAGSERSDKLGSKGKALQEGNNINKSLTVLGRCIRALIAHSKDGKTIVPFRESVLTWYLRDSLSGNARTTMLAACSPVASNMDETLSTLRYAASAKNIKTAAVKNEDPAQAKIRELSSELEVLKRRLEEAERGGGRGISRLGSVGSLTSDEKAVYLNELNAQMSDLKEDGFEAIKQRSRRTSVVFKPESLKSQFPMLTCLSKDNMLSHVMTIPIQDTLPFIIGRTKTKKSIIVDGAAAGGGDDDVSVASGTVDVLKNNFNLDGMGIQSHHCVFERHKLQGISEEGEANEEATAAASSNSDGNDAELLLRACSSSAVVCVNGVPINEMENGIKPGIKLKHLDRIVLGPCRLICLYLTHELSQKDRSFWNYDACFTELSLRGKTIPRSVLSPARCKLLDLIAKIETEEISQCNAIACEMGCNIRFSCDLIVNGTNGLSKPNFSMDEFLDTNHPKISINLFVDLELPPIKTALDLSIAMKRPKRHEVSSSLSSSLFKDFNDQNDNDNNMNIPPPTPNTAIVQGRLLDALRDNPFDDFNLQQKTNTSAAADAGGGGNVDLSEDNLLFDPFGADSNLVSLCSLELDDFDDIFGHLKATHASLSRLTGGLRDAMEDDLSVSSASSNSSSSSSSEGLFRSVFNKIDVDKNGTIDHNELELALQQFNETNDHDFIDKICIQERISNEKELTYDEFEMFLISFLQHSFYRCIEHVVTNRSLFIDIGGRDITTLLALQDHDLVMRHKLSNLTSNSSGSIQHKIKRHVSLNGQNAVIKFLQECKLDHHSKPLLLLGVDNLKDLFDPTLLSDSDLKDTGFTSDEIIIFRNSIASYELQPITQMLIDSGLENEMLSFIQAGIGCMPDASYEELERSNQQGLLIWKLFKGMKAKELNRPQTHL